MKDEKEATIKIANDLVREMDLHDKGEIFCAVNRISDELLSYGQTCYERGVEDGKRLKGAE